MPNALLETLMRCDLGPRAMRVMLFLTRQTAGYHRASVELSYADIAAATNVGQAKVPEVLRELLSRQLIERHSGYGKKNRFVLPAISAAPAEAALPSSAGSPPPALGCGGYSQNGGGTESEKSNRAAQLRSIDVDLKKSPNKIERNSLSAPDTWQRYLATLSDKARERADLIFIGIKSRFPTDDPAEIAACPENMQRFGAPDGTPWTEIRSPHGLMESAWPQLRDFYRARLAHETAAQAAELAHAETERRLAEQTRNAELAHLAESEVAVRAFEAAYSDAAAQEQVLARFKPTFISNFTSGPGRSLAIEAWYRATHATSTQGPGPT